MPEDTKPNVPVGDSPQHKPPVDGSKLPPITGNVKIEMAADGMVSKAPLPPITGGMAVTEPLDMLGRRKPATK